MSLAFQNMRSRPALALGDSFGNGVPLSGEYAVDDWIRRGASVNKLALGLVTYSRSFQLQSAAAGQTPGAAAVGYPSCPIDSARWKHYPAGCLFLLFLLERDFPKLNQRGGALFYRHWASQVWRHTALQQADRPCQLL